MGCFQSRSDATPDASGKGDTYIKDKYICGKTLGKGGSCTVMEATQKSTGEKFALKIMFVKEKVNKELYEKERDILQTLDHTSIIKFVECHVDVNNYYMITQLCLGGELFDRIIDKRNPITEKRASQYIRTMLEAIKYCHDLNIVHRDIKPENFVFKTRAQDSELVLIDFGCAKIVEDETKYDDLVGTPYYLAPESAAGRRYVRTGSVLKSSDLWSIGVIAYVLMTGRPPFNGNSNQEIFNNIIKKPLRFPAKVNVSQPFIEFCRNILKKSPKRRMKLDDALNDAWVKGIATSDEKISEDVIKVLRQFNKQSKLKKAITSKLARNMSQEPKKKIEDHFNRLDKDGNGALSADELSFLLMDMGYTNVEALKEANEMIKAADQDNSGSIKFTEFASMWQRKLLSVNESYIHNVFEVLDADGNGLIDPSELAQVLDMTNAEDDVKIQEMIEEVDTDNDGKVNFQEFKAAMLEKNFGPNGADVGHKLNANDVEEMHELMEYINIDDHDL